MIPFAAAIVLSILLTKYALFAVVLARDHNAVSNTIATSVHSNTVPSLLKGEVIQFSEISMATNTTPHPEACPAVSAAAAKHPYSVAGTLQS